MKNYHAKMDESFMKKHHEYKEFNGFAFEGDLVYVSKKWIEEYVDVSECFASSLEDGEMYETTLTINGFHNVESGIYGIELSRDRFDVRIKERFDARFIESADLEKKFMILADGEWSKFRPKDVRGYYALASNIEF